MRCIKCSEPALAGQALCSNCVGQLSQRNSSVTSLAPTDLQTPTSSVVSDIKTPSVGEAPEASSEQVQETPARGPANAQASCIKCEKLCEPGRSICVTCLGKSSSSSTAFKRPVRKHNSTKFTAGLVREGAHGAAERNIEAVSFLLRHLFLVFGLAGLGMLMYYAVDAAQIYGISLPSNSANQKETEITLFGPQLSANKKTENLLSESEKPEEPAPSMSWFFKFFATTTKNAAPHITITTPKDGALTKAGNTLAISAEAFDTDGFIKHVRMYINNQQICETSTPPFSCEAHNLPAGTHLFQARAFDNAGESQPSTTVVIKSLDPLTYTKTLAALSNSPVSISQPSEHSHFILDPEAGFTIVHFRGHVADSVAVQDIHATVAGHSCITEHVSSHFSGTCRITEAGSYELLITVTQPDKESLRSALSLTASYTPNVSSRDYYNPFYSQEEIQETALDWGAEFPDWADSDPGLASILPVGSDDRLAPVLTIETPGEKSKRFASMQPLSTAPTAGSFDDYFASFTKPTQPLRTLMWVAPSGATALQVQPRIFGFPGGAPLPAPTERRSKYGTPVLASQGFAFRSLRLQPQGRALVLSNGESYTSVERDNFFLNTLTVASLSPHTLNNQITDQETASSQILLPHALSITATTETEAHAIIKLIAAGSFLPPQTKRLLKSTGNYAPILQWLWRAALPYSDDAGSPLPFSDELRHRAVYLAHGEDQSAQQIGFGVSYHGYDEALHMQEMARLATSFKDSLPPITILSIVDYSVEGTGKVVMPQATWGNRHDRISLMTPTAAHVVGEPEEALTLRVDLGYSYDLFRKPLQFTITPLYPEHRSLISIKQEGPSRYVITARYSAHFSSTTIPVIATAANELFTGTPAFIHFEWRHPSNEIHALPNSDRSPRANVSVVRNKPPVASSPTSPTLVAAIGDTVRIPLSCVDPEGAQTRWLRWAFEPGEIQGGYYALKVSERLRGQTLPLHFICSDGSGSYASIERTVVVSQK